MTIAAAPAVAHPNRPGIIAAVTTVVAFAALIVFGLALSVSFKWNVNDDLQSWTAAPIHVTAANAHTQAVAYDVLDRAGDPTLHCTGTVSTYNGRYILNVAGFACTPVPRHSWHS
jgi:hypothetical protein